MPFGRAGLLVVFGSGALACSSPNEPGADTSNAGDASYQGRDAKADAPTTSAPDGTDRGDDASSDVPAFDSAPMGLPEAGSDGAELGGDASGVVLAAGSTNGVLNGPDLAVDVSGTGTAPLGAVAVSGGRGTVEVPGEGPAAAFVVEHQAISGFELYETVVVAPDRLTFVWFYCESGVLDDAYWEDSRGQSSGAFESSGSSPASGTCTEHLGAASVPVALPAFSLPAPPLVGDVTVTATGLTYDGQNPGTLVDQGIAYGFYPFHHINCAACATPGWQELHALLLDSAAGTVSFGIVYLFPAAAQREMLLAYAYTLPTLAAVPLQLFPGSWTGPPGTMIRPASWLPRPPPPRR
jgi:hypothetical protein